MSQNVGNTVLAMTRMWHHVSLRDQGLGRTAVKIARLLMGKDKPMYDQAVDYGDYVVATSSRHVLVSGRKEEQKVYRHHTRFPGGLKTIPYKRMMERQPEKIVQRAVSGMLPKNQFRKHRLRRLLVFPEEEHPYQDNIIKRYDLGDAYIAPAQRQANVVARR